MSGYKKNSDMAAALSELMISKRILRGPAERVKGRLEALHLVQDIVNNEAPIKLLVANAPFFEARWRPASEPPDHDTMNADWVLGVVSGRTDGVIYDRAVLLVGYGDGEWFLEEDPAVTVSVSHWMPLPDLPEEVINE